MGELSRKDAGASPCTPHAPVWLQKAAQKNPAERKGDARDRSSQCSPHPALVLGRQLSVRRCGGAQRGRDGPFRAKVMCGERLALTWGSPESLQPCREDLHKSCPFPFEPGLSREPLRVSRLGDAKPWLGSP